MTYLLGGTGYLGQILIEKLLRCCTDINKIYILIRPKKQKDINDRIKDMFDSPVSYKSLIIPNFCNSLILAMLFNQR